MPGTLPEIPTWFPDARLNFAENLLYRRDDGIALTEANESGILVHVTFRQLYERVREMADACLANGLKVGDRVAGKGSVFFDMKDVYRYFLKAIVTNSTHAIVIALAVASIGGIFSSTATDMGTQV